MRKTRTYGESLVPRIIDLIDGYSTDSILKEYLQNADDSGATELIITFDKRIHHKLSGTAFATAKGPALLIENNSFFKDSDFESIAKISDGSKRNDPSKTGRFGQGFSCSFSVSDDPSLISSGRALWFDVLNQSVNADDNEYISEWDDLTDVGIKDWLNSFSTDKTHDFINKTIFRLPLRTQVSDISSEVFKFNHFLAWCDEWKQNASNLLFLRNIHKLVLQEVTEDGTLIKHLVIETDNTSEIEIINRSIQADFDRFENAIDMCDYWLSNKKVLPHYQYVQEFSVAEYCREKNVVNTNIEKWAVVNGLFNGPDDILIEKAIEALSIKPTGRKVLPWAGVAIRLNAEGQPDKKHKSSFYSFLPLDISNPFPVSIHGWFDLDSKRTEITFTGGGEVKEILKAWNRSLLKHAVAVAWAELIEFTKGHQYFDHYFSLWPKKTGNTNYDVIVPSFYQSVVNLETLYVVNRERGEWLKPRSDQWVFKDFEDQELLKILTQSYSIILGNPSRDICKNLRSAGAKVTSLDAKTIYAEIKKLEGEIEYPLSPEQLPYPFINDTKDLLGIVNFLIKEMESKDLDFSESPFSLSVDGYVYPPTAPLFAEEDMDLSLLQNKRRLVLHSQLSRFQKEQYGSLSEYWLDESFENLVKVIDFYFEDFQLDMEWVESLVDLIANASRDEIQANLRAIKNLPIALCEDDIWLPLNSGARSSSPLYIESSSLGQYELYRSLGFKLFEVKFHETFAKLNRHSDILMRVSEEIIVQQIINSPDIDLTTDEELRLFVLGEIANNLEWVKNLNNAEKYKFRNIPLVKTDSGRIRKLDSECKLYLSAGFTAPNHLSNVQNNYEVIITESDKERELYRSFEVTTLEPYTYLKDVVLPYLNNRENLEQAEVTIRWIVSEWNNIKDSCDEIQLKDIVTTLSEMNIAPRSSDGELFKAKELYHPELYRSLPTDLQLDSFCVKLLDDVSEHQWTEFLDDLSISSELLTKHFQRLISEIEMNNDVNRAISLWNYVISNFEQFERVLIGKRTLIDELANAAIFPVEDARDQFSPSTTWSALSKASSLITSREYYLLGLSYFSTHRNIGLEKVEDAEFRRKLVDRLGFVKVNKEKVIKNFEKLKEIQATQKRELNKIVTFAKRFYSYVGRFKDIYLNEVVTKNSIRLGNMWVSPARVFENKFKISNTYCWNELISNDSNAYVSEGLRKLGVTPEPKSALLLDLLNELPQQIPLEGIQLSDAKAILDLLRRLHLDGDFEPGKLSSLLSTENTFERIGSLLVNDSPNYEKAESKNEELKFVANKYKSIAESAHVKSIHRDSDGHLNKQLSKEATSINEQDLKVLFEYLSKKHFKDAIRRIYAHENDGEIELFPEGGFIPQSVHLMEYLVIDFYIDELWVYSIDSMTTYREGEKLFVVNQEDDDLWDSLASYIAESAKVSDPDNLMLIRRLIKDPRSKSEIEGFLDNKNIALLLIQDDSDLSEGTDFYIEQTVSIPEVSDDSNGTLIDEDFGEFNHEESDPVRTEVDHSSIDIEKYNERDSVQRTRSRESAITERSEEKNEGINTASGSKNTINIRQNDTKRSYGGRERPSERNTSEIDPPTRPKTSQSTANEVPPERKTLKLKDVRSRSKELNGNINAPTKPSGIGFSGTKEGTSDTAEKQLELPRQSSTDKTSPNNRLPIYVYSSDDAQNEETIKQNSAAEIGDKGEDYIVLHQKRYLMSPTNRIEKAPKNNKGYDLVEFSGEDIIRFIEVKTLTGIWGEGGVSLTSAQFDFAVENKHWWLFVVENVNAENTEVHRFENPVRLVNRFSFDSSWKKMLDVDKEAAVSLPEKGDKVKLPGEDTEYEVIDVKPRGEISLYTLISASGKSTKKPYNASWVKV